MKSRRARGPGYPFHLVGEGLAQAHLASDRAGQIIIGIAQTIGYLEVVVGSGFEILAGQAECFTRADERPRLHFER